MTGNCGKRRWTSHRVRIRAWCGRFACNNNRAYGNQCVCVCVSCLGVSHWEWGGPRQSFRKRAPHLAAGLWLKAKCMKKKKEQQLIGSTSEETNMQSESSFIFSVFYCPLLPFCLLKASVGYSSCWDLVLWVQSEEQQTVWRKLKSLTYSGGCVFVCLG